VLGLQELQWAFPQGWTLQTDTCPRPQRPVMCCVGSEPWMGASPQGWTLQADTWPIPQCPRPRPPLLQTAAAPAQLSQNRSSALLLMRGKWLSESYAKLAEGTHKTVIAAACSCVVCEMQECANVVRQVQVSAIDQGIHSMANISLVSACRAGMCNAKCKGPVRQRNLGCWHH
jgi:hypothetical protein